MSVLDKNCINVKNIDCRTLYSYTVEIIYKERILICFKKGPKNDYNQHFVDTGERPQNFIRDAGLAERFEEYPKQKELIKLKDEQVTNTNLPIKPMFIRSPLRTNDNSDYPLNDLIDAEFEVILGET